MARTGGKSLNQSMRFEVWVPRHIRERLNALARHQACTQGEVLAMAVQCLEASLSNPEGLRYTQILRRRICAPEGAHSASTFAVAELPDLPAFEPPLGVTYDRSEILDTFARTRVASLAAALRTPAAEPEAEAKPGDPDDVA